jgi:hypothetical protein
VMNNGAVAAHWCKADSSAAFGEQRCADIGATQRSWTARCGTPRSWGWCGWVIRSHSSDGESARNDADHLRMKENHAQ